jgi:uncharacterized protein (TIGR04141 family)
VRDTAPSSDAATHALNLFLLKADRKKPEDILTTEGRLSRYGVSLPGTRDANLYLRVPDVGTPSWLSLFLGATKPQLPRLQTASTAAVLLVPRHGRIFALTFGYGRHLLRADAYEENFGLRVTLNSVHPERLTTIDHDSFEAVPRHTREQASREAGINTFGINIEQDLLRAVTGTPTDESLGLHLSGRDSLTARVKTSLAELPRLIDAYARQAEKTTYRRHFPWADHINAIRDPSTRDALDQRLLEKVRAEDHEKIWLAIPDLLDWRDIAGFRYTSSKRRRLHSDLHLATYLRELRPAATLSLEHLKNDRAIAYSATTDREHDHWPIYRCLYAELEDEVGTCLLSNGHWYRVERDFVRRITTEVQQIPEITHTLRLPAYIDDTEGQYIERVGKESGGRLAILDRQLIPYGGAPSSIEACDLYSDKRQFIHVKRYGGSSVLSHLFNQGYVAGSAFLEDSHFRELLNEKLPHSHRFRKPTAAIEPRNYEIVFAVISRSAKTRTLPFFSRVTLRRAYQTLRNYGYRVSVANIIDATQTEISDD